MTLVIEDVVADALAREVAQLTGESVPQIVREALRDRLERERAKRPSSLSSEERIRAIQERVSRLPILDHRSDDEILGYNANGHFD